MVATSSSVNISKTQSVSSEFNSQLNVDINKFYNFIATYLKENEIEKIIKRQLILMLK